MGSHLNPRWHAHSLSFSLAHSRLQSSLRIARWRSTLGQGRATDAAQMTILRRKLWEMAETLSLEAHPARIEALRAEHGHSIVIVESGHAVGGYTCAVHAFHLIGDPTYTDIAGWGMGATFAGAEFVEFLLSYTLLTPRSSSPVPGDLIIYLDAGTFKHVGRMKTEARVLSKWGLGLLYEHSVREVPLHYGQDVQYFVGTDDDASFDLFIRYAESKGFRFQRPQA